MKTIRTIFLVIIILLSVAMLAGCPPRPPKKDELNGEPAPISVLTAKEAWEMISPVRETFSDEVVPVYVSGSGGYELPMTEGKSPSWSAGLYSDKASAVWNFNLSTYYYEEGAKPEPDQGERRRGCVALETYDLDYWYVDSPEACAIAAKNGVEGIGGMSLQAAADMELMDEQDSYFKRPGFIPGSTKLLWVIVDEDFKLHYIDAHTGDYLGSCTAADFTAAPSPPPAPGPEAPADTALYLDTDARDDLARQYDPGADIDVNFTIHSALEADEYRVTYCCNGITPPSPAEYSTEDPAGSFGLAFRAPDEGKGKIIMKLRAFAKGEVIDEARSCLYWSSCGRGVFASAYSGPLAELAMAKVQFDAHEISSYDYYEILQNNFVIDADLMARLGQNSSFEIARYGYAKRHVEAVHNYIFGNEPEE